MHEEPQVPNYGPAGRGMKIKEGHVLAIEPMVNAGHPARPILLDDGWTVVTEDGRRSAHFEHTIACHRARPRGPDPPLVTRQSCRAAVHRLTVRAEPGDFGRVRALV